MIISTVIFVIVALILKSGVRLIMTETLGALLVMYPIAYLIVTAFDKKKIKWYYHIFGILWVNLLTTLAIFMMIAISKNSAYAMGNSDEYNTIYLIQIILSSIYILMFKQIKAFRHI